MQTNEFRPVYRNSLTINILFSLLKSTIECASPVKENIDRLPNVILSQPETDNNAIAAKSIISPLYRLCIVMSDSKG